MKFRTTAIILFVFAAFLSASEDLLVPFKNLEGWLKTNSQSRVLRRSSLIKQKALIVHAIDRRDLKEGKKSEGLGRADFELSDNLANQLSREKGEVVEGELKSDQVHYYYYKTNDPSSVKATLAWSERSNSNLNLRVIGNHGGVRPWSQSSEGVITRNQKESNSTVERVDTEVKANEEIRIKVSAPHGIKEGEKYLLLVSGCEFSERQKRRDEVHSGLVESDNGKKKRVKDYIRKTGAALDSVDKNDVTYRLVDVVDDKPVYYKTFNLNAAKSASTDKVWPSGGSGLSLTGKGLERSLGIWDAGTCLRTHQEVTGRVTYGDNVSAHSHSSHVGGTMIGSGVQSSAKGMAYEASLVSYDWNSDASEMSSEANNGMLVSQHSYGSSNYSYNRQWDQIAEQYPMYLASKSASNDSYFNTVSDDGNCKNVITVGSAVDYTSGFSGPSTNGSVLSSFSSKGPAPDGRIKPDILANGQGLYSMVETGNSAYGTKSGTSMSGPSLAASLALLQEHYYNLNNETYMSSATLKGLAIHTADEVDAAGPDYSSGWGYVDTKRAADLITLDDGGKLELIQTPTLSNGETFELATVHNNGEDIDITIIWNDPAPSSNYGDALVNDLDLRVFVDGAEHEPWMLPWTGSNDNVKAIRGDNDLDNVEKVQIKNVSGNSVDIVVTHKGSLDGGSQKFTLLLSGVSVNTDPYVNVSSPNGGEEWELYSTQKIRWSSNVDSPVDILLMDGTEVVDTIAETATNSGTYDWFIKETLDLGSNYKIKIICVDTTDIYDNSDDPFSLVPEELISQFPFVEPFESYTNESEDIGDWAQEEDSDDMNWLVYKGVTPTGQYGVDAGNGPGTGPLGDHTTGDGQYVYIEASYNYEDNKSADLTSAKFDLRGIANPSLKYWLQMYAQDGKMGDLNVDVSTDGVWTNDVKTYSGSQGEDWFTDSIDLSPFAGKRVQFRFRGTVGDSFYSDICLDDIGVSAIELPDFSTITNGNAKEGVEYSQSITITSGVDGVVFELENAPSWLSVSSSDNSSCTISGTPVEGDAGTENITIKFSIGSASKSADFDIVVAENTAPVFRSTPITEVDAKKEYIYEITLEDSDSENELSIAAENLPAWLNFVDNGSGSATLSGTPENSDSGNYVITLAGDDGVVTSDAIQEFDLEVHGDGTGLFDDGKKNAKESGLEGVPSIVKGGDSDIKFYLASKNFLSYELNIYDNSGNVVKAIDGSFKAQAENMNLSICGKWDGINSNGRICASGIYSVYLKAIKADGSEVWYKTVVGIER